MYMCIKLGSSSTFIDRKGQVMLWELSCVVGCGATILASSHWLPIAAPPPVVTNKNIFTDCQISPSVGKRTKS